MLFQALLLKHRPGWTRSVCFSWKTSLAQVQFSHTWNLISLIKAKQTNAVIKCSGGAELVSLVVLRSTFIYWAQCRNRMSFRCRWERFQWKRKQTRQKLTQQLVSNSEMFIELSQEIIFRLWVNKKSRSVKHWAHLQQPARWIKVISQWKPFPPVEAGSKAVIQHPTVLDLCCSEHRHQADPHTLWADLRRLTKVYQLIRIFFFHLDFSVIKCSHVEVVSVDRSCS